MTMKTTMTVLAAMLLSSTAAFADDPAGNPNTGTPDSTAAPTPKENLPAPVSTHDPAPPVASPGATLPPGGIVEQAGVGGPVAYGRAGVLELGGSAGLALANNMRDLNFSPSIGWFVADNLELSGILSVSNVKAGDQDATMWGAVVEPSYHIPFNRSTFAFLGMGIGAAYENQLGTGLAVAPRVGMNILVGRSGVLTPSLTYEYTSHGTTTTPNGSAEDVTVVELTSALRMNIGYTAMW